MITTFYLLLNFTLVQDNICYIFSIILSFFCLSSPDNTRSKSLYKKFIITTIAILSQSYYLVWWRLLNNYKRIVFLKNAYNKLFKTLRFVDFRIHKKFFKNWINNTRSGLYVYWLKFFPHELKIVQVNYTIK